MVEGNNFPATKQKDKVVEAATGKHDVALEIQDSEADHGSGEAIPDLPPSSKTEFLTHRRYHRLKIKGWQKKQTFEDRIFLELGSIPRIPKRLREVDNDAYEPRIISIGPYHWGKPMLHFMEEHKWKCLKSILKRNVRYNIEDYLQEIEKMEEQARNYYENIEQSTEFVKMMLLDGCFIVEYFLRGAGVTGDIKKWMKPLIHRDLLLLENQLPFMVVKKIYCMARGDNDERFLHIVQNFCAGAYSMQEERSLKRVLQKHHCFHHFLHLYYKCLCYNTKTCLEPTIPSIPSATFLEEAGIKIQMMTKRNTNRVIDVTYKNGIMKIKPMSLDAFTISKFRNLIALEKFNPSNGSSFTAFAKFVDYIIDTSKDVALLKKAGIIKHAFGSDEEVATIFNRLTSNTIDYLPSELATIYHNVDEYCKTKSNYWWATFKRDYCGTPWATISIAAAVILLLLTLVQTFFSMYSYFRPPSPS